MALDAQAARMLSFLSEAGATSFEQLKIDEFREAVANSVGMQKPPEDVAQVHDVFIPSSGGKLSGRVYVPHGTGPFPIIVYFHGGGWVGGGLPIVDEPCRALANRCGAIVLAATYRLAPENKFPSAVYDAYETLVWARHHASTYGGDKWKLFVLGDSAGGNLAAAVALMARDKDYPRLAGQVLLYPVVDAEADYPSMRDYAEGYFLHTAAVSWFWSHYLASPADARSPYASPIKGNLVGLPPALVITVECDPVRDEGEAYAERLIAAGVPVSAKRFDGLIHGTFWASGAIERAQELYAEIAEFVKCTIG